VLLCAALAVPVPVMADPAGPMASNASLRKPRLDDSVRRHVGMASYYARRFAGRKMADGTRMRPESDNAASRMLPLGSRALVTNLSNGRSAVVTIRDRGPFAKGRIIDLSPSTAQRLGIIEIGVARVEVIPLSVPQPDGSVRTDIAMAGRSASDPQRSAF